jgi:hypothetical protein
MSITGRPKGMNNFQLNLNWGVLCKDLKHIEGFTIADNNAYIQYNLSKDEYITITKDNEKDAYYHLNYTNGKFTMQCQDIKNDNILDSFLNKLILDNWDIKITGKIQMFKLYQGNEEDLDEEDA